jgi:hypothetical protein
MALDLNQLKKTDPTLHADLAPYMKEDGTFKLMPPALVERLQMWVALHPDYETKRKAYNTKINADIEAQLPRLKEEADKRAALARLNQYADEQGLLPGENNIREIKNFIASSVSLPEQLRGKWTIQTVDLAIGYLSREGKLEFKKQPVAVAPAASVVQSEVILSDGSAQLPLGTIPNGRHSVVQLRDLDQRERAAKGRVKGTFGARF